MHKLTFAATPAMAARPFPRPPQSSGDVQQYHELLRRILAEGVRRDDRTGTGTLSVFGHQMRFDISPAEPAGTGNRAPGTGSNGHLPPAGRSEHSKAQASRLSQPTPTPTPTPTPSPSLPLSFPLLTTKKLHLRSIIHELLWFLRGETNIAYLKEHGVSIWDEWADADGDLGPVYGKQWRSWAAPDGRTIDQISGVLESLRNKPESRRHVVTAWNPADVDDMALPPCHCLFQFYVAPAFGSRPSAVGGGEPAAGNRQPSGASAPDAGCRTPDPASDPRPRLSLQLYQRSADVFLGVPFNIASYALLAQMVAHALDYRPHEFIHTLGDAHLYLNHVEQAELQLSRDPRPGPTMRLNPAVRDLFGFRYEDFTLERYDPHPHIRASVAV